MFTDGGMHFEVNIWSNSGIAKGWRSVNSLSATHLKEKQLVFAHLQLVVYQFTAGANWDHPRCYLKSRKIDEEDGFSSRSRCSKKGGTNEWFNKPTYYVVRLFENVFDACSMMGAPVLQ